MTKKLLLFGILIASLLVACEDDSQTAGADILPSADAIVVSVDTFGLSSALCKADFIYSTPDSFLLGECDNRFGTIHADILSQFACPVGFEFPEGSEVDSICVYLYYRSWYGDGNTPMQLSIYEMDKATFNYSTAYPSNLPISDYCSLDESTRVVARDRIITASHPTDSLYSSVTEAYVPFIRFKLNDTFAERFFKEADFSSQEAFNELFKGLYITSNFGSATMLHVFDMNMTLFYHFSYEKNGKDTTVNDTKAFYANSEVRQVNRIEYLNFSETDFTALKDNSDSCFIVAPANIYTRLSIPMSEMSNHIIGELGERRPYVNRARLMIDVLNKYTGSTADKTVDDWAQPSSYMLLLKESALTRFFKEKELPSDTCALLSSLTSGTDTAGNVIYYYNYDLSTLLTQQLREEQTTDSLRMVLVPVAVTSSSSSDYYGTSSTTISAVRPQQTISATTIRSASNTEKPMRLEVVYSGF